MMKRFKEFPEIKEEVLKLVFVDDGVKLSDLYLSAIILCCVDGTSCSQAVPSDDNSSKFLFYIKGDPQKIRDFIDAWCTGNKTKIDAVMNQKAEQLRNFTTTVSFLKLLLDKAKIKIIDESKDGK